MSVPVTSSDRRRAGPAVLVAAVFGLAACGSGAETDPLTAAEPGPAAEVETAETSLPEETVATAAPDDEPLPLPTPAPDPDGAEAAEVAADEGGTGTGDGDDPADGSDPTDATAAPASTTTAPATSETTAPPTTAPTTTTAPPTTAAPPAAGFPDLAVVEVASGAETTLAAQLAGNGRPVLLWFWGAH